MEATHTVNISRDKLILPECPYLQGISMVNTEALYVIVTTKAPLKGYCSGDECWFMTPSLSKDIPCH